MSEFTEGEWKAVCRGPLYGQDDIYEIHWSKFGECVAEIVHGEANANLFAASKDMYEALKMIRGAIYETTELHRNVIRADITPQELQQIRDALVKAEGQP